MTFDPSRLEDVSPASRRTISGGPWRRCALCALAALCAVAPFAVAVDRRQIAERGARLGTLEDALAHAQRELADARRERDASLAQHAADTRAIADRDARIQELSETAEHWLARATEAAALGTDDGDGRAIALLDEVPLRWPHDRLATLARSRKADLEARIAERKRASTKLLRLIATCANEKAEAQRVLDESLAFTPWNDVDLNSFVAGNRAAAPHLERAKAARSEALALLKRLPDPTGELRRALDACATD
jgi:hypothetical protein